MKNTFTLLICSFIFFSCINKNPKLNEEDFKNEQLAYENIKKKVNENKVQFFNEHRDSLMKKIRLFKKLKDTATVFKNVNSDTTFFFKNVRLNAINYNLGIKSIEGKEAIFLNRTMTAPISKYKSLSESYAQLYSCLDTDDESCTYIEKPFLQQLLDIKYAFVIDGYTLIEPNIESKKSFQSGLFVGSVLVYDLIHNKPLYRYAYSAQNSEQITYREQRSYFKEKPLDVIKDDFENNIIVSFRKATKKHFNFN